MTEPRTLYLARGRLQVAARGYWFSSGGGKASFGFIPHLKSQGAGPPLPFFPDTQVCGDLRMAAAWLRELGAGFNPSCFDKVFGKKGAAGTGLLRISDLELDAESRARWTPRRFEIKPRIAVEEASRAVSPGMLVNFELAYLEGLGLEAQVFLGYFDDPGELAAAKRMLAEAAGFLSGFGALRSRGCGRGRVSVRWEADEVVRWLDPGAGLPPGLHRLRLKPLVNLRNRKVEPGKARLLASEKSIPGGLVRAWFARSYNALFGEWPAPEELSALSFFFCHPGIEEDGECLPGFPPPFSTTRAGDGTIEDRRSAASSPQDSEGGGTLIRTKRRRLRDVEFLTCGPRPRLIRIRSETRVRNAVQPSFATLEEGGLFVQELVFRGALFCGRLRVGALREEFGRRARFIFGNLRPEINGAIFEASLELETPQTRKSPASMNGLPRLVTEPIELLPEILDGGGTQLMIGSLRSYNTTLRRPRRNRIAILPGSVLPDSVVDERCLPWEGFDAKVEVPPAEGRDRHAAPRAAPAPAPAAGRDRVKGVGRSQFGRIRELQSLPPEAAIRKVKAILDKYASRKAAGKEVPTGLVPAGVLEDLLRLLKEDPRQLAAYIDALAASHAAWRWEEERAEDGISRKERAREELIRERTGGNVHP